MARDAKTLARIHRVRTLQLTLAQGEEARARAQVASEAALNGRIAALAAAVAPAPALSGGMGLRAAAHYRERLHQSADAAALRVERAELAATRAIEATRAARQDQGAVEKLVERAERALRDAEMRDLEDMAVAAAGKRHSAC